VEGFVVVNPQVGLEEMVENTLAVRKTPSFLVFFPMFVPSLSWQNDRFYI
jgi:hypothetical protein